MSCNIMMDYGGIHKFQPPASRLPRVGGTGDIYIQACCTDGSFSTEST